MRTTILSLTAAALLCTTAINAQTAGTAEEHPRTQTSSLGRTPQMGWSTWNKFGGDINEELIKQIADEMVAGGLRDAGYVYINMDDCWHGERDADGFITADAKKFPNGIKALADYVHSKGLKLGIYSDAGRQTCAGRPGSFGHEYQDALQYARWEIDYLKYDWCDSWDINARGAYGLMNDALKASGRDIFFSMCEWGSNRPWEWAGDVAQSWRTTGDIYCAFDGTLDHGNGFVQHGVLQILDMQEGLRKYAGPGHWNDPDMLEVGNGLSTNEDRAHFSMWCMLAAPLILGNDIRNMSQETKDIVFNRYAIAIDQDTLGVQGFRYGRMGNVEMWFKPLSGGDWAFCLLNRGTAPATYTIDWQQLCLTDTEVSKLSTDFDKVVYDIHDVWNNPAKSIGTTEAGKKLRTVTIAGHDVVMYRLVKR